MQEPNSLPHWLFETLRSLAWFAGGGAIVRLITLWVNRHKSTAEVGESEARAIKTRAEAWRINVEAVAELDAIIRKLHARTFEMQVDVDEIRDERDRLKMEVQKQELELLFVDQQMKRMKGFLDSRGIKLSDYDEEPK